MTTELILYQPAGRPWGMPNLSPFCIKLETYLRMAEVPHTVAAADFRKAPKGKIPYVALDGKLVGDSQLVINELERRAGARALDHGLSARDAAIGHAMRRMIEEGMYFIGLYTRWETEEGWAQTAPVLKQAIPSPKGLVARVARRINRKKLHAQGTGRHTVDEIHGLGAADYDALATLLGDQPYVLGDRPRVVDCTLYAFLEGILRFPCATPLQAHAAGKANLVAYRDRIRHRWFADLDKAAPA